MTYKELIKKIDTYNEIAELIGADKMEIRVNIGFSVSEKVKDSKSFAKFIKDEYIDEVADAILRCSDYTFDNTVDLSVVDRFGDTLNEKIEFYVCAA